MNRCYTESDVIAESRGWNAMSGDNDVVCVLWICVVVGTESYVCDQLPKLPEEPPPIGDCAGRGYLAVIDPALGALFICRPHVLPTPKSHNCNVLVYLHRQRTAVGEPEGIRHSEELGYGGGRGFLNKAAMQENWCM